MLVDSARVINLSVVSLFTREWIEIPFDALLHPLSKSPSLRGSGLKFKL